ncbi:hypothetical protein [Microbacterium amylolyticum]|uniref:NifU family protein n=1 Tax=Microbacterium amylolyticum TaxID=936337 RepID=A0ABS4ZI24_9MICO|nr:hypothetical protein [Microbacterium amylolyticum]MBP2436930.1 hypothetical protein [Microbacterium amylolyticum]
MPANELSQLQALQETLRADDYHLSVERTGDDAVATIAAGPTACAECLVPKDLMRRMLAPLVGVEVERIRVNYPVDVPTLAEREVAAQD